MRQNLVSEKWCWDIDDFLDAFLLAPPFPHGNLFLNSLKPERAPSNLVKIKTKQTKKPFTFLGFFIMFLFCFFLPDSVGYYGVLYVDEAILEPIGKCLFTSSAGIKGLCHHSQLKTWLFMLSFSNFCKGKCSLFLYVHLVPKSKVGNTGKRVHVKKQNKTKKPLSG